MSNPMSVTNCIFNPGATLVVSNQATSSISNCIFNATPGSTALALGTATPSTLLEINGENGKPMLIITTAGQLEVNEELVHYGTLIAKIQNNLPIKEGDMEKLNPKWRTDVVKAIIRRVLKDTTNLFQQDET